MDELALLLPTSRITFVKDMLRGARQEKDKEPVLRDKRYQFKYDLALRVCQELGLGFTFIPMVFLGFFVHL